MQDQSRVVSVFGGFRRDNQTLRVEIMKLFTAAATPQHSGIIRPGEIKFTTWLLFNFLCVMPITQWAILKLRVMGL